MLYSSGIGTYISHVLLGLVERMPQINFELLLHPNLVDTERGKKLLNNQHVSKILLNAEIYTIAEQIEIYHKINNSQLYWSPHYNVPLFLKKPLMRLVTIHDVYHLAYKHELSLAKKIYAKVLMQKAVKSEKIITVSNFSKDEIVKYTHCDPSKIDVIYNGIESTAAISSQANKTKVTTGNPLLKEQYIIYVGNVKPHKNLTLLIDSFAQLKNDKRYEDLRLVIIGKKEGFITGDAELFQKIESMPQLKNELFFTGWIEDDELKAFYANAQLLVFPSVYEGFGLPPLEAMSMQCPVASSNAACMQEINGKAALYFDPTSVTQLSEAISSILQDAALKQKLLEAGKDRSQQFTWEKSIEAHEKLIASMIK